MVSKSGLQKSTLLFSTPVDISGQASRSSSDTNGKPASYGSGISIFSESKKDHNSGHLFIWAFWQWVFQYRVRYRFVYKFYKETLIDRNTNKQMPRETGNPHL